LDDTDPVPAGVSTSHPVAASTSSTLADTSQQPDPVIALGERIVAELGDPRTNNTLTRWLAHHTARLIREADTARETGSPDVGTREAEARDAILQLWQARATWPVGWPPPRAAKIARVLDDLPSLDDDRWHRQTLLTRLQDTHHHVLSALSDLLAGDSVEIEQGWLDTFGEHLTSDEVLLLRRAANQPASIGSLLQSAAPDTVRVGEDTSGEDSPPPTHPLVQLADAYHAAIATLIQRAAAIEEPGTLPDPSESGGDDSAQ
jgi:hypothetical protein